MRKKYKEQPPLTGHTADHPHAAVEIELIDKMPGRIFTIYDLGLQDHYEGSQKQRTRRKRYERRTGFRGNYDKTVEVFQL